MRSGKSNTAVKHNIKIRYERVRLLSRVSHKKQRFTKLDNPDPLFEN